MEGVAGGDVVLHQKDPQLETTPVSPRPEWAELGVPCGDDLLRSGPAVNVESGSDVEGAIDPEEHVKPKLLPSPATPSKQEIAEHRTTHLPPRN